MDTSGNLTRNTETLAHLVSPADVLSRAAGRESLGAHPQS